MGGVGVRGWSDEWRGWSDGCGEGRGGRSWRVSVRQEDLKVLAIAAINT